MLLITHTWILREFLGNSVNDDAFLDLYAYNAAPDLLPIHQDITSELTHSIPRFCTLPPTCEKAAFVQFHLLVDDIAHHGRIERNPVCRFNPDSEGYTYVTGRPLMKPLNDLYRIIGEPISYSDLAYRTHMIIEMAFDMALYKGLGKEDLLKLFVEALNYTLDHKLAEFSRILGWLYGLSDRTVRESFDWGKDACTLERMHRFMNEEGRVGLFIDKFGLDRNNPHIWSSLTGVMEQGLYLVRDYEAFLDPTLKAIKEAGFVNPLQRLFDKS
ncbi:MAG: hypothetical protein JW950_06290 [Deltaproteobacteria bacterium]|nr:hypothetical protein [Deltaproteobacteria bacterium]